MIYFSIIHQIMFGVFIHILIMGSTFGPLYQRTILGDLMSSFLKILGLVVSSASSSSFPVLNTEHTFHRMYMNGSPFSNSVFAVSQDAVIHSCPSRVVSSPLPSIRVIECSLPGKLFSNAYCSTTIPVHWCR